MKTLGRIFIWLSISLMAAWVLPWVWNLIVLKPYRSPFTLYSCVVHDFTGLDNSEGRGLNFIGRDGTVYGDSVQPMFYANILQSRGELPDTIEGRAIDIKEIEYNSSIVSYEPENYNKTLPPVYLLLESVPERLELKDPSEVLISRKDGIHVFRMEDNAEESDKSGQLCSRLRELGFVFPAKLFAGNPSHRKAYDEGYLLTDSEDKVYHIKQVNGEMTAEYFPAADRLAVKHMIITEFENRATLGYLVGEDMHLYMLRPDGTVTGTEVIYDPSKDDLLVIGDMFYQTVKISDQDGEMFYALDSEDFSLVDKMYRAYPEDDGVNPCKYFLPFRLRFTSADDGWMKPRLSDFSWTGLAVYALITALFFVQRRKQK